MAQLPPLRDARSPRRIDATPHFACKERFTITPYQPKKSKPWFLNPRPSNQVILEIVTSVVLILLLLNTGLLSSQVAKTNELLAKVQLQVEKLENARGFSGQYGSAEGTTAVPTGATPAPEVQHTQAPQPMCPSISTLERDSSGQPELFNAANYFFGASVDSKYSSDSENFSYGRDQSGYVILDRKDPPPNKAWCSDETEPLLIINLAKTIQPVAVSYQHSQWNGTVPDGAPKVYDVEGCLDPYCVKWETIAENCTYQFSENEQQEQMCPILANGSRRYGYEKVQFRFRENYGNVEKTCAFLVRVYGEAGKSSVTKGDIEESEKICRDLTTAYHDSPFVYANLKSKSCSVLYKNQCCTECPECCEKCEIEDVNSKWIAPHIIAVVVFLIIVMLFAFLCCFIHSKEDETNEFESFAKY